LIRDRERDEPATIDVLTKRSAVLAISNDSLNGANQSASDDVGRLSRYTQQSGSCSRASGLLERQCSVKLLHAILPPNRYTADIRSEPRLALLALTGRIRVNVIPGESTMNVNTVVPPARQWTASELRKLPPAQRDMILEAAAALAEQEYRNDPQLTAFEAFGKDDLHGDSSSSETR
jgi:hypothetical protein